MFKEQKIEVAIEKIWVNKKHYLTLSDELKKNYFIIYEYIYDTKKEEVKKLIKNLPDAIQTILEEKEDPLLFIEEMILEQKYKKQAKQKEVEALESGGVQETLKMFYHLK